MSSPSLPSPLPSPVPASASGPGLRCQTTEAFCGREFEIIKAKRRNIQTYGCVMYVFGGSRQEFPEVGMGINGPKRILTEINGN